MRITKDYLRKLIKESLQNEAGPRAEFYLVYDEDGRITPPKIFSTEEEARKFVEKMHLDDDIKHVDIIPMDYNSVKSITRAI